MAHHEQSKPRGGLKKLWSNMSIRRHKSSKKTDDLSLRHPEIPSSVWISHIFPCLDRQSQNRLAEASRDVYEYTRNLQQLPCWPQGRCKVKNPISSLALSPDGTTLAVAYEGRKKVSLWNSRQGYYRSLVGHTSSIMAVQYSPDGMLLASASRNDGTVRLWRRRSAAATTTAVPVLADQEDYQCVQILEVRHRDLRYLKFSPKGDKLVTWGNDGSLRVFNVSDGASVRTIWKTSQQNDAIECQDTVAFSMDGTTLAYVLDHQVVRLWNFETYTDTLLEQPHGRRRRRSGNQHHSTTTALTTALAYSPDNQYLVIGCHVATINFYNVADYSYTRNIYLGQSANTRSIHLGSGWSSVTLITFSSDGKQMACTTRGSQIHLLSVSKLVPVDIMCGHTARVEALAFCQPQHGRLMLVSGGLDRTVRFWNLPTKEQLDMRIIRRVIESSNVLKD
jgi:WD40 repeat protein